MSLMPVSNEQTFSLDSTYVQDGATKLRYYIPKIIWFWLLLSAKPYWISYRLPDMDRIKSCYLLNYLHEIDPIFFSKIHLRLPSLFLLQHYGSVSMSQCIFTFLQSRFTLHVLYEAQDSSDQWRLVHLFIGCIAHIKESWRLYMSDLNKSWI